MSKEELLKPRYKVFAEYPGNNAPMGWIYETGVPEHYDKYPAVFKKLEWWEDRKPEEMPEYLLETEAIENGSIVYVYKNRKDFKYTTATFCIGMRMANDKRLIHLRYLQPATEQEYNDYINSKNS